MKRVKTIILFIIIIIMGCAFKASAQTRPERTSSHRAYYGTGPATQKFLLEKKKKTKKPTKPRPALGTRSRGRIRAIPI